MQQAVPSDLIIVVGRQCGSGGRALGKMLAEAYGLEYYDKEMLSKAAEKFGYSQSIFAKYDEKRPSAVRTLLTHAFGVGDSYLQNPMSSEAIYNAQSEVIRRLAARRGCVFVGRSADYILRDHPHLVSIFLSAPIESRAELLIKRGDAENMDKAMEMARRQDHNREQFYNYYTGRRWGHADNYHLCFDARSLGTEAAFSLIRDFIELKFAETEKQG